MKIKIAFFLLFIFLFNACSEEDEPQKNAPLSEANEITSFQLEINGTLETGEINQANNTITMHVINAELESVKPVIALSNKASIEPLPNVAQDFTGEVIYTVYAENGTPNVYKVHVNNRFLSRENKILSFAVEINETTIEATIDEENKLILFNAGEFDISALSPKIDISEAARIFPESESEQNFNNNVTYTVTSENGDITEYTVLINAPKFVQIFGYGGYIKRNPSTVYSGAKIILHSNFMNTLDPNTEFYLLVDGVKYPLTTLEIEEFQYNEFENLYEITTEIPYDLPSYKDYEVGFSTGNYETLSGFKINVVSENVPKVTGVNQEVYQYNDVIEITGTNLTSTMGFPSNGSYYIIKGSNGYDYTLNEERTKITFTFDYSNWFYHGSSGKGVPFQKRISLLGPQYRLGPVIETHFMF